MIGLSPRPGSAEEQAAFAELETRLPDFARSFNDEPDAEHVVVVVASASVDAEVLAKLSGPAHYEERLLSLLLLLRRPRTRVVYCSSSRIPESVVDYYLHLLTGVPRDHAAARLTMVSCDDASARPLTEKLLDRPRRLDDIRRQLRGAATTALVTFMTTPLERTLATQLDVPLYGNDPALAHLGTKSGSRETFKAAGIDLPDGAEGLRDADDIAEALSELKGRHPDMSRAVVKLEEGFSGEGNALFRFDGIDAASDAARRIEVSRVLGDRLEFVAPGMTWDTYQDKFDNMGGIVEAFVEGDPVASPSAQLRIDPTGYLESLSTHDQILGGASGQIFEGSTFPADTDYRHQVAEAARAAGEVLRTKGARGRFAIDFMVVGHGDDQRCAAIEINLRKGGTTHPMLTLELLTNGTYDPETGEFRSRSGRLKTYLATDDLEKVRYRGISPEDLIDLAVMSDLHYDPQRERGVVFHMLGALSEFGKIGMTCIADDLDGARRINDRVVDMLDAANGEQ